MVAKRDEIVETEQKLKIYRTRIEILSLTLFVTLRFKTFVGLIPPF